MPVFIYFISRLLLSILKIVFTGSSVSYTNWLPDHLNNFAAHDYEDCVAFIPYKHGKWDDIHCGESLKLENHDLGETHPVLCQYGE